MKKQSEQELKHSSIKRVNRKLKELHVLVVQNNGKGMYKTVSVARAKLFFANYKKKCAARAKLFFLLITSVVVIFYHSLPLSLVLLDFVFSCLLPPPPHPLPPTMQI